MGKKVNKRKRIAAAAQEVEDFITGPEKRLETVADESLFVIDTTGSSSKRKKVIKEETRGKASEFEEKRIERIISNKLGAKSQKQKTKKPYDAWADEPATLSKRTRAKLKSAPKDLSKKVSHKVVPATSYNPSVEDYKEGIRSIISKDEAIQASRTRMQTISFAPNPSADMIEDKDVTMAIADTSASSAAALKKKNEKLTRTQRNKAARRQDEEKQIQMRKDAKVLLHDIEQAKKISKELSKQQREAEAKRKEITQKKLETEKNRIDITDTRVEPVLLPDELPETLRQTKLAGGLLKDHMFAMHAQKMSKLTNKDKRVHKKRGRKKVVDRSSGFPAHMKKW